MAYFSALREIFSNQKSTIPFDILKTNIGGGYDPKSGIFKAPSAGVYMFTVSGIGSVIVKSQIFFVLNGAFLSTSWAESQYGTYAMQHVLELKAGDKVSVYLEKGGLGDTVGIYNHFTGIQLE